MVTFPVRVHPHTCKYTKKVFGPPIKHSAGSFFTNFHNREGISYFSLELVLSLSFCYPALLLEDFLNCFIHNFYFFLLLSWFGCQSTKLYYYYYYLYYLHCLNYIINYGMCDQNKSRARHHCSLKPGSKLKYLGINQLLLS